MSKETGYLLKGLFVLLLISAQIVGLLHGSLVVPSVKAEELPEQWDYNDGSWTLIDKLGLPIRVNLPIGDSWTYVFNLDNDTE
ncbi:MAG: hypothetical protein NWE87_02565, partial [Candidatus Bathyarchaeota archaeon]|nr:hypothetical protein [Candidatus Bathyarchaeota archaeon]